MEEGEKSHLFCMGICRVGKGGESRLFCMDIFRVGEGGNLTHFMYGYL